MTLTPCRPRLRALLALALLVCVGPGTHGQTRLSPPAPASETPGARLDRLEAGVHAVEAVRAVKRLQQAYGQYLGLGLWSDVADLFTDDAVADLRRGTAGGRAGIRQYFMNAAGRTSPGLAESQLNAYLILQPIVTLGADATTARATWHEVAMLGRLGASAVWEGGIYEAEYALHDGVWKISRLRYFPQYDGTYESKGHKAPAKWDVPYHFDAAHVGVTIPAAAFDRRPSGKAASPDTRLGDLAQRVERLADETSVLNLQNSYGYYLDRKLWDDVADLFAANGSLQHGARTFAGRSQIRQGLETLFGPSPLRYGELFDHLNLTTVVTVAADGRTAHTRTTQLSQLGRAKELAEWEVGTYENEFVKDGGIWKLKAVRYVPQMTTTFDEGWGRDFRTAAGVKAAGVHYPHPVTGQRARAAARPVAAASFDAVLANTERRLDAAIAIDAVENLNSSYGYYIDESDWDRMADTFATKSGAKEITGVGVYVGRERIRTILNLRGPRGGRSATFFTIHQLTQPVIHISDDGHSAKARLRLFQLGGSANGSSGSWIGGIYENTAVKENGEWKFGVQDLHHTFNAPYRTGWANMNPPAAAPGGGRGRGGLPQYAAEFPPDRAIRARQYTFPEITEPAFHYRNPVSGRMPAELLP